MSRRHGRVHDRAKTGQTYSPRQDDTQLYLDVCSYLFGDYVNSSHVITFAGNYDEHKRQENCRPHFKIAKRIRHNPVSSQQSSATIECPRIRSSPGTLYRRIYEGQQFSPFYRHIYYAPSSCWAAIMPATGIYDPSRSKASALSPTMRYLYALLAHTLTGRQESIGIVNTHDAYFLWSMRQGHIFDLAYFIALAFRHQTERY
ncbi:hypothetical protein PVK06_010828 [Gossypium arboreum]|uniref:Uncharacterized protein n=1 Tax=Gossypium arboreum TaxID=29729 RepID=A0ABR0Q7V8_GOSAR|nr:hypothetical protein PVK06_010828 [Gossypium arboreum]